MTTLRRRSTPPRIALVLLALLLVLPGLSLAQQSPDADGLHEGFGHKADPDAPQELLQGTNSQGNVGYDGPVGTVSRAFDMAFHLYALDSPLELDAGADRETFFHAIEDHVVAEAEQPIRYRRPS